MAEADTWGLQLAIYNALETVMTPEGIHVVDHVPSSDWPKYVRIDGLSMTDTSMKNRERGRHSFMVHVFDRGTGANVARGTKEALRLRALCHAAVMAVRYNGKPVDLAYADVETDSEGGAVAHAFARYSIHL